MTTLVGRYEVTETLGGGGFAITYLAKDTMQPSKPLCVVKQLRPNQDHPRVIDFFYVDFFDINCCRVLLVGEYGTTKFKP